MNQTIKIITDSINKFMNSKIYGKVIISISFENGKIVLIRKNEEETIKP